MDKLLGKIEEYAKLFFTPKEVAILCNDLSLNDKLQDGVSPEYMAYKRGVLTQEKELRLDLIELAQVGSPKAQEEVLKLINKLNPTCKFAFVSD